MPGEEVDERLRYPLLENERNSVQTLPISSKMFFYIAANRYKLNQRKKTVASRRYGTRNVWTL